MNKSTLVWNSEMGCFHCCLLCCVQESGESEVPPSFDLSQEDTSEVESLETTTTSVGNYYTT